MNMLNSVALMGRMVADPEMRTTPNGVSVMTLRLACDRDFKNKQTGERETDFVSVVAWKSTAEYLARYGKKGRMLTVLGRLQNRQYTDRDGEKRTITEIQASSAYFADVMRVEDTAPQTGGFDEVTDPDGDLPF